MDAEELVKILGPLLGLAILGLMIWRMFKIEDAGKKITGMIQSRKLIIADVFLVALAFMEGLVAANMGDNALGDSYTTRFTAHLILSMVGAYSGFICIKEVMDFANKLKEKHTILYMLIQFMQPLLYFIIAAVMPIFNLIIISKGAGSYEILSYLWSSDYGFTEVFGALDDVTARSLLMVAVHILLTAAVALGSVDDVKTKKDKSKDKSQKDKSKKAPKIKDEDLDEKGRPNIQASIELMADAVEDTDVIELTKLMANAKKSKFADQHKGRITNLSRTYMNLKKKMESMVKTNDGKAIENLDLKIKDTKAKFNKFYKELKELNND